MTNYELVEKTTAKLILPTTASDDMVAMAAWVSFDRDSEERLQDRDRMKGLINFLMREKHMSPFEHGSFTFKIDCPLYVAREFHRHRTMSYNEVSGRYTKMNYRFMTISDERPLVQQGKAGQYVFVPGSKEQQDEVRDSDRRVAEFLIAEYERLLAKGIAKEVARTRLPLSMMTQFYATVNPRNLMQFLELRTTEQALYEIRDVAKQMEGALASFMPMTYAAWKKRQEDWRDYQEWKQSMKVIGHMGSGATTGPPPHFQLGGNTGRSTGPHLHFQVDAGEHIMTKKYIHDMYNKEG